MSIAQSEVVAVVAGLLSDPGTSSKDVQKVVARAIDYVKEVSFQVKKENDKAVETPKKV
jgi:uncharacterized protein (UPF0264 family)